MQFSELVLKMHYILKGEPSALLSLLQERFTYTFNKIYNQQHTTTNNNPNHDESNHRHDATIWFKRITVRDLRSSPDSGDLQGLQRKGRNDLSRPSSAIPLSATRKSIQSPTFESSIHLQITTTNALTARRAPQRDLQLRPSPNPRNHDHLPHQKLPSPPAHQPPNPRRSRLNLLRPKLPPFRRGSSHAQEPRNISNQSGPTHQLAQKSQSLETQAVDGAGR